MTSRAPALAVALLVAAPLAPVGAVASGCGARTRVGRWTYVASPAWPADNEGLVPVGDQYTNPLSRPSVMDSSQAVVGAANPKRILLSNHRTLLRSMDGGCTWSTAFSLSTGDPKMLAGLSATAINQVAVPLGAAAAGRSVIYLTVYAQYQYSYAVVRSDDDGKTWTAVTPPGLLPDGMPQQGIPDDLAVAPSNPAVAYLCLMCHQNAVTPLPAPTLYVTRNRGATWTVATLPAYAPGDSIGVVGAMVTVDPVDPASIWLRTTRGIYHSADSGAHWTTAVANVAYDPVYLAPRLSVFHRPGQRSASVVVPLLGQHVTFAGQPFGPNVASGLVSRDGGKHWQRLPDLPLIRLGFTTSGYYRTGPLSLAFDASGEISGWLSNTGGGASEPNKSAVVMLRGGRWLAAHVPFQAPTFTYDAEGNISVTAAAPSLVAAGLSGAHGTTPALAEYALGT